MLTVEEGEEILGGEDIEVDEEQKANNEESKSKSS